CTNLLDHPAHATTGSDALETVEKLHSVDIEPMQKTLLVDLAQFPELPGKLEGLSIVDHHTIVVANDNDFGFSGFDANGRAIQNGQSTYIWTLNTGGKE